MEKYMKADVSAGSIPKIEIRVIPFVTGATKGITARLLLF